MHRFDVTFVMNVAGQPESPSIVMNTWHFRNTTLGTLPTDYDNVRDMLQDFYQELVTNNILSTVPLDFVTITAYSLNDPEPRQPVYSADITLTGGTGNITLPHEVAMVITFEAERESGTVRGRRRNRKFLGPLVRDVMIGEGYFSEAKRVQVAEAARDLLQAAAAATSWEWVIYSPSNDEYYAIHDGYIDNAPDTQKRRGLDPTARTVFSSTEPAV